MSDKHVKVTDDNFRWQILDVDADLPILVDFWAPWCGPCQAMAPVMDALAISYDTKIVVAKCNVDQSPQISARYGVQSIPTLILFDGGRPVEKIIGLVPVRQIEAILDRVLSETGARPSLMTI